MKLINRQTIGAALVGGVTALVLAVGGVAFAHGGPHGGAHGKGGYWTPEKIDAHIAEMTERLDLSPAQEQQIRSIVDQAQTKAAEIREMPRSKEKMVAFRDLHFATEDQIYANLSCEQREGLRLLKREHRVERMEEHFQQRQSQDAN
jgi:Spy/CpxP family protein refolding chaperone